MDQIVGICVTKANLSRAQGSSLPRDQDGLKSLLEAGTTSGIDDVVHWH